MKNAIVQLLAGLFFASAIVGISVHVRVRIDDHPDADPLYRFTVPGGRGGLKAGFIDGTGRIVIPAVFPTYQDGSPWFRSGRLSTQDGVFDRNGKQLPFRSGPFSGGLAAFHSKDKVGFVDREGRIRVPPVWDEVREFSEGLAAVKKGWNWGYIDSTGKVLIEPRFPDAGDFREGMARVVVEGPCQLFLDAGLAAGDMRRGKGANDKSPECRDTFIDRTGRALPARFTMVDNFSEGLAGVGIGKSRLHTKWGFANQRGEIVIPATFPHVGGFSDGLAPAYVEQASGLRKGGFIDRSGRFVIPAQYDEAFEFREGVAAVAHRGRTWYIDRTGKRAVPGDYLEASRFHRGLAHVRLVDPEMRIAAYIDRTGRKVFQYQLW